MKQKLFAGILKYFVIKKTFYISSDKRGKLLAYEQDTLYRGADKSLARPTSQFILFDGENISFDANLAIYK